MISALRNLARRISSPHIEYARRAARRKAKWDSSRITDPWFGSHFGYAADETASWLGSAIDLTAARIMDFGCGDGITASGIALKFAPRQVTGVDISTAHELLLPQLQTQLGVMQPPENLNFLTVKEGESLVGKLAVNAAYSWSVFEHITRDAIPTILRDIYQLLPADGVFFIQIEPLYYSPFGSHLSRQVTVPWAHLLRDEATLKQAVFGSEKNIGDDKKDGVFYATSDEDFKKFCWQEYTKLNRLTADELVAEATKVGFAIIREHRGKQHFPIPPALAEKYDAETLLTNEIRLLLKKS